MKSVRATSVTLSFLHTEINAVARLLNGNSPDDELGTDAAIRDGLLMRLVGTVAIVGNVNNAETRQVLKREYQNFSRGMNAASPQLREEFLRNRKRKS